MLFLTVNISFAVLIAQEDGGNSMKHAHTVGKKFFLFKRKKVKR